MNPERLDEIRGRVKAASPGPWFWRGNYDNHDINLSCYTSSGGQMLVMDMVRWGMQGACPRFSDGMIMVPANTMIEYVVCPDAIERSDRRVYRGHINDIRHPDAQFIAHARQDMDDLLEYVAELESQIDGG